MKHLFYIIFITCFLSTLNTSLWAQNAPKVDLSVLTNKLPASPTAAELGKYGEVPVSLYNGMPQVNIPIASLKGNEMAMPLSLSYHASGVKVNQIASWVGLGWSLNAGGVITREVRDQPDDVHSINTQTDYCMFPCLNCNTCTPATDTRLVCDDCNLFRTIPVVGEKIGYLYNKNNVMTHYNTNPEDFTDETRKKLFGVSSGLIEVRLKIKPLTRDENRELVLNNHLLDDIIGNRENARTFLSQNCVSLDVELFLNSGLWDTHFLFDCSYIYANANIPYRLPDVDYLLLRFYIPEFKLHDTEADIFNFNFNGYSGQFVFDTSGTAKILSNDDLKITYTLSRTQNIMSEYADIGMTSAFTGGITEFKVTTPDGAVYVFNEKEVTHSDSDGQSWPEGIPHLGTYVDCDPHLRRPYETPLTKRRAAFTSWYLSKVYNPMGQLAFDLEYDKEVMIDHSSMNQSKAEGSQSYSTSSTVVTTFAKRLKQIRAYTIVPSGNQQTESVIFESANEDRPDLYYPTWLTTRMGNTLKKSKALRKIIFTGGMDEQFLKEFSFGYGAFASILDANCTNAVPDYVNKHKERLKLLSLTETGNYNGTATLPLYSFEYNATALPPRHSPHQDFWGYYNGPTKTQSLLPKLFAYPNFALGSINNTHFQTIYSIFQRGGNNVGAANIDYFVLNPPSGSNLANNRNPDAVYSQAGVLQRITYPTKGTVSFVWEDHKYTLDNFMYVLVGAGSPPQYSGGGVRIQSVINSEGVTKNYAYTKNLYGEERTSGRLVQLPNFGKTTYRENYGGRNDYAKIMSSTTISSSSHFDTRNGSSHVGYEQVTESIANNGKTIYYYNVPALLGTREHSENGHVLFKYPEIWTNNYIPPYLDLSPYAPLPNYDWNRGLLLKKEVFAQGATTPLQVTTNTYELVKFEKIPSIRTTSSSMNFGPGMSWNPFNTKDLRALAKYYTLVADKRLKTVSIKDYYGTNVVETLTSYNYNTNHKHPISTTLTNSDGKVYRTEVIYSKDFPNSTDPILQKFNESNILVPLITKLFVDNVFQGAVQNVFANHTIGTTVVPLQTKWIEILSDNTHKEKASVEAYNAEGRVTQWKHANHDVSEELFYSTTTGLVEHKKFGDLHTYVTYHPNTRLVTSVTNENNIKTTYEYDPLLRVNRINGKLDASGNNPQTWVETDYFYRGVNGRTQNEILSTAHFSDLDLGDGGIMGNPNVNDLALQTQQYLDGLGRPTQTVKALMDGTFSKNYIQYDAIGRQERSFQLFQQNDNQFATISPYLYASTSHVRTVYEPSPLNRPIQQIAMGAISSTAYGTNTANEVYFYRNNNEFYPANSLHKTILTDENGKITTVFKDKVGRTLLTRKSLNGSNVDTYNLYDDAGQLIAVLPPGCMDVNSPLAFRYEYDLKRRLVRKRVSGADWQSFHYDNRDLLVLTQDANTRRANQNQFLATQYDNLARPIKTGWVYGPDRSETGLHQIQIPDVDALTKTTYVQGRSYVAQTETRVLEGQQLTGWLTNRVMARDEWGKPTQVKQTHLEGEDDIYTIYNSADKPILLTRSHLGLNGASEVIMQRLTYDEQLRPVETYQKVDGNGNILGTLPEMILSQMQYNFKDQVTEKNIGQNRDRNGKFLQSIDYLYNVRGWLTHINGLSLMAANTEDTKIPIVKKGMDVSMLDEPIDIGALGDYYVSSTAASNDNDENKDLFSQLINYDVRISGLHAFPQNNGNISSTIWQVVGREKQGYGFKYDDLNRLTEAYYADLQESYVSRNWNRPDVTFSTDNAYMEKQSYDVRGNITSLQRNGLKINDFTRSRYLAGDFGQIDDLHYAYNDKNQVTRIEDYAVTVDPNRPHADKDYKGFVYKFEAAMLDEHYRYDANGNLVFDAHKDIERIEYNYMNLPSQIVFTDNRSITFIYDATGKKLRKTVNGNGMTEQRDYLDGIEYKDGKPDQFLHSEGSLRRDEKGTFQYYFVLRDHLGNTRVTFADLNQDDEINEKEEIVQINHFYPFGLNMEGNWNGKDGANKYQYNGKEWNDDFGLGWNDYGARFYDPAMARWQTVDPLSEKYVGWSPYNYTMNNPICFIDPDGRSVDNTIVTNEDGSKQFTIVDNKPDAVAIFSNEEFDKRFGFDFGTPRTQFNTNVDELRRNANGLYMVNDMIKLEKFALTQKVNFKVEWYLDKNGKRITNLYPEESGALEKRNGTNEVIVTERWTSRHDARLSHSSGGFSPHIHIHTNGYRPDIAKIVGPQGITFNDPNFGGDITSPPSERDFGAAIEVGYNKPLNDIYNVVVSPGHIHLYRSIKGNPVQHIVIDRSNLSKVNQR
jgi:RHS repeat-associated protein